jgi:carbonic anhydrase
MTIEESLKRLKEGNFRFVKDKLEGKLQDTSRREFLIEEQKPFAVILSCADSRVVPEIIFDAGLGELFVVRVAGNVANSSSVASVEYCVSQSSSKLILVLGHQNCGAVTAAVKGGDYGDNLNHLLNHISPAIIAAGDGASIDDVAKKNANYSAKELEQRSAIIGAAVAIGEAKIVAAYYHLDTGRVDFEDSLNKTLSVRSASKFLSCF